MRGVIVVSNVSLKHECWKYYANNGYVICHECGKKWKYGYDSKGNTTIKEFIE